MDHNKPLFEMSHGRVAAQVDRMKECERLGICPFCWENLEKWHDAPVIKGGRFWAITANDHPYAGTNHHYLAIYRYHVASISEIEPAAGSELLSLFSEFCEEKNIPGATILMRTGNMLHTGATLSHLHAHIISGASREEVPNLKYPDSYITSVIGYKVPQ